MTKPEKMLELYQYEECPYCKNVRAVMTDLGLSYVIHNVSREREARDVVQEVSGQRFVPVLVDPNTDTMIADDDEGIAKYLNEKYG